nr:O-antigen ligase family protein [Solitalea lacus]
MFIIIEKSDESTVPNYLFLSIFLCSALVLNLPNNKLPAILFKVLLFTSMIVLGARSPILFGSLIMIVYYSVKYITSIKKMVLFYTLAVIAGTGFFSWKGSERLFDRFESISSVRGNRSFDNRVYYQQKSIDMIFQRPFLGTGFGSFAKEMKGKDIIDSPHNLFLEMGFETGIVGMLLMILFFVFTFRFMIMIIRQTGDLQLKDLILRFGLIIVYFFLTAFVSLYLSNSKDIFGLIGCFLALGNAIIYEEKCQNKQQLESGDELRVMT